MQTSYPTAPVPLPLSADPTLATAPPSGRRWHPPRFTGEPRLVRVTPRMADVLSGFINGRSAKEIGKVLWLTEDTVKTHAKRLYAQLGARNQAHAVSLFLTGEVEIVVSGPQTRKPAARPPLPPRQRQREQVLGYGEHDPL